MWKFLIRSPDMVCLPSLAFAILCLSVSSWADPPEDMERLAAKISDEIRGSLLTSEAKVAYVGKGGTRAYLMGDLSAIRPGQSVVFHRDGSMILSDDSPPQVLGRESVEVGRGRVTAVHDRTAWVQIEGPEMKQEVGRGDAAIVQLDRPLVRIPPFYVDEGAGLPQQDGRGRILRSLVMYQLKSRGFSLVDAPLMPSEIDASGLPLISSLRQFDTDGVLLIGRLLPKPGAPDQLIVGIALFDLSLRDIRFARSYDVRTLAAFVPIAPGHRPEALSSDGIEAVPEKAAPSSVAVSAQISPELLTDAVRLYLSTSVRRKWPPKTPGDAIFAELVAPTLPELALEWIEDTAGQYRIVLPPDPTSPFGVVVTAPEVVDLMTGRSQAPPGLALLGPTRWSAPSDSEIVLSMDKPKPDVRERLMDPHFRLIDDRMEPLRNGLGPYRILADTSRLIVLEKTSSALTSGIWAGAPPKVIFYVERNPKKRSEGFGIGEVDIYDVPDEEYLKFGPQSPYKVVHSPPEELVLLAFNLRRPPVSNVRFRKMIALSLDRKAMLGMSLNQRGELADGLLPPAAKGFTPVFVKLPYRSLSAAQSIAREWGDTVKLGLMYPIEETHYGLIAAAIRSDLAAVKVAIELQGVPWRTYASRLEVGDYDLTLVTSVPAPPYRLWMEKQFTSSGKDNLWGYRSSLVDALLSESGDVGAGLDLIHSELPVLPLFWLSRRMAHGNRVSEFGPSAFSRKFFSSIRLK